MTNSIASTAEVAVQDLYPEDYSHCYGCGRLNADGLHVRTIWDGRGTARFTPRPYHIAMPGWVYGGLLASLVDCHGIGTAAAAAMEARGEVPGRDPTPRFVTAALHVDYLEPTPAGPELTLTACPREVGARKVRVDVEVMAAGVVTARGSVLAVRLPGRFEGGAKKQGAGPASGVRVPVGWAAALADGIADRLRAEGTPERAEHEKAYLKSDLDFLGATVPAIRRAAKAVHREHAGLSREDVATLVETLWDRGIHELRRAAVELLDLYADRLTAADAALVERLLRESRTWALVDGLAASVAGGLRDRFPDAMDAELARWASDDDFWLRRASLLAYLPALRRGAGDFDRFAGLADTMLEEREFFIRKAIGWVLRETGKKRPELVVAWLEPRLDRAAGLTVREALKSVPEPARRRLDAARGGA